MLYSKTLDDACLTSVVTNPFHTAKHEKVTDQRINRHDEARHILPPTEVKVVEEPRELASQDEPMKGFGPEHFSAMTNAYCQLPSRMSTGVKRRDREGASKRKFDIGCVALSKFKNGMDFSKRDMNDVESFRSVGLGNVDSAIALHYQLDSYLHEGERLYPPTALNNSRIILASAFVAPQDFALFALEFGSTYVKLVENAVEEVRKYNQSIASEIRDFKEHHCQTINE